MSKIKEGLWEEILADEETEPVCNVSTETYGEVIDEKLWHLKDKDHINPKYYQEVIPGHDFVDLMHHLLGDKTGIEAMLFGMAYKYMIRCGRKDNEVQELKKAKWYIERIIKLKEGNEGHN